MKNKAATTDIAAWVANFSPETLALNAAQLAQFGPVPHVAAAEVAAAQTVEEPLTDAEKQWKSAEEESEREKLVRRFEELWRRWEGPALTKEYKFSAGRRWRMDYYHEATRTAIEIHGGVWTQGRHTRGRGYLEDLEKMNAAQMLGIRVLQLGTGQVDDAHVGEIADYVRRQAKGAR